MQQQNKKSVLMITLLLCTLALAGIVSVFLITKYSLQENTPTADVYQNGNLIASIPLNSVKESYTFTVRAQNGGSNVIEVRKGAIGIVSADCPDRICVHQGFITDSVLPITCLPHRLVIQIRKENMTWD